MDIAQLVLDYLAVLVWPVVIVILVVSFKAQLVALLKRVTEIGGPAGFRATFGEQVEELFRDQDSSSPTMTATHAHNVKPSKRVEYDGDYGDLLEAARAYRDGEVVALSLRGVDTGLQGIMFAMGLALGTGGRVAFDEHKPTDVFLLPADFVALG